jgi:two-component system chemotaxis sensor kinase CheA
MAIPLSSVARLEQLPRSRVEKIGSRQVVQYRGEILPLIDVSQELDRLVGRTQVEQEQPEEAETISVVVFAENDERVGLVVGNILDIVSDPVLARSRANRPGTLFTSIVQEKVTEFIDVAALVRATNQGAPQIAF